MRKLMTWIVRIAVLLILVQVILWSWDQYQSGDFQTGQQEVLDSDKVCRVTNPDLGSCVCVHRETNERLDLTYEECRSRASDRFP